MPTAHLIHGFIGAGKTVFARRLEEEQGAVRFTHDEWMHRLYGAAPPCEVFADLFERVEGLIWQVAERLLGLGVDVIMDFGFWSRASRDNARARVLAQGAGAVLYRVTCPEATMRERVLKRSEDVPGDSLWIDDAAFEMLRGRFEPLESDEARVEVDGLGPRTR
jgi:predicted kinase